MSGDRGLDQGGEPVPPCCPLCTRGSVAPLCRAGNFQVWRCLPCAFDFVHPVPPPDELSRYYDRPEWFEGGEQGGYRNYDEQTDAGLSMLEGLLSSFPKDGKERSVLDIGCAYGSHLALARDAGWKCFGVEPSIHARGIAWQRLGRHAFLVESVSDLMPRAYDLILMLDVLEHLPDPVGVFYELFSLGAITPETRVVITTPNARCGAAVANPCGWQFRHPPSHLCFFSAGALSRLMKRLRFRDVTVAGFSLSGSADGWAHEGENGEVNRPYAGHQGLQCSASGSDFVAFRQERYVPFLRPDLAWYEHVPRYQFAFPYVKGGRVLDFGCGTGYGTALLAAHAREALGVDIDADAVHWAQSTHGAPRLGFERRDDLAAGIPGGAFDLITCFEMIEHVDASTQRLLVAQFRRILGEQGLLLVSTPNPEVTVHYGDNPYHKHEMGRPEFLGLLREHFSHVALFGQHIRKTVIFDSGETVSAEGAARLESLARPGSDSPPPPPVPPVAFLALCSAAPLPATPHSVILSDVHADPVREYLDTTHRFWHAQQEFLKAQEECVDLQQQRADLQQRLARLERRSVIVIAQKLARAIAARSRRIIRGEP